MKTSITTKPKGLTRKQQAFVTELLDNPKQSATKAALKTYNVTSNRSAEVVASENLRKPEIMAYLRDRAVEAEHAVIEVLDANRALAHVPANGALVLASAREILDRVHGKATQKVESTSIGVVLNIDLTARTLDNDVIDA